MSNKVETTVTLARGGMHSVARYREAKKMILDNKYSKARLYHLILKGSTSPEDYQKAAEAIVRMLRENNIPCSGKGCWEVNEERGLHFHLMLLVDAGQGGKVDWWLTVAEDGPLKTKLAGLKGLKGPKEAKGITVHIAPPQNDMHRTAGGKTLLYAYVPKSGPKLEDALVRISYLYKKDSKDDSMARIYYSTRTRNTKTAVTDQQVVTDKSSLDAPSVETNHNERNNETITPQETSTTNTITGPGSDRNTTGSEDTSRPSSTPVVGTRPRSPATSASPIPYTGRAKGQGRSRIKRPSGGPTKEEHQAITGTDCIDPWSDELPSAEVVPFGLPLKQSSSIVQKILYKTSELAHNNSTIF